jgi:hypothetical protein
VTRLNTRQLGVGDHGQTSLTSPVFGSEIIMACWKDKSDQLTITTKDFVTEIWAVDFSRRFGLPLVERRLFGPSSTPTTTAMTSSLLGGKAAIVESYFWDPPNLAHTWYSFWDSESALPLMDRAYFVDDIGQKGSVESVRMDSTGHYLVFVNESDAKKAVPVAALQLAPPASLGSWIADLAEAVAGVSVSDDGALVPVPDRLSILARGSAELGKLIVKLDGDK